MLQVHKYDGSMARVSNFIGNKKSKIKNAIPSLGVYYLLIPCHQKISQASCGQKRFRIRNLAF